MRILSVAAAALLSLSSGLSARAQDTPAPYQAVLTALGRAGDFKDGVLKINLPRTDLKMTINGRLVPTGLGFGGWIAMTDGTGMSVMMGDLVLTEDQVNPVMSAVLDNGLEATAVHNHFFWEQPRIFYMHVHGHGAPADLAKQIKPALDLMMKGVTSPAAPAGPAPAPAAPAIDGAALAKIIGTVGEQSGAVYKITMGRPDLSVKEMGATINARMGLNTWAAFTGTNDDAIVAGDVAMLGSEVQPVLKAMRKAGISVVSLHHHMIGTQPELYFMHYFGQGPAATLATGVKSAISLLGK